jgi:hypothetical protein
MSSAAVPVEIILGIAKAIPESSENRLPSRKWADAGEFKRGRGLGTRYSPKKAFLDSKRGLRSRTGSENV